jgi:hypothetical protein
MYTEIQAQKSENRLTTERVDNLKKTIKIIRNNAIQHSRMKMPLPQQNDALSRLLERRDFVQYFRHALAHEIARVLATYDQHVQAVYLFDESINPDAETEDYLPHVDLTIHLLLKVTSNSAALGAFITSLDRVLTEELREMPDSFADYTSFLDVIPITEQAVQERRGFAALLSSIYARPLKVWPRE